MREGGKWKEGRSVGREGKELKGRTDGGSDAGRLMRWKGITGKLEGEGGREAGRKGKEGG